MAARSRSAIRSAPRAPACSPPCSTRCRAATPRRASPPSASAAAWASPCASSATKGAPRRRLLSLPSLRPGRGWGWVGRRKFPCAWAPRLPHSALLGLASGFDAIQPPVRAVEPEGRRSPRPEPVPLPGLDPDLDLVPAGLDPVEALLLAAAQAGRGRRARLDDQLRARRLDHLARRLGEGAVIMAGQEDMDSGLADRLERALVAADPLGHVRVAILPDRHGEQGVVGDQDSGLGRIRVAEARADHIHLLVRDAAVLEGQRAGGVDA